MQIIRDIDQTSDEWFKLREQRLTASEAQAIGNCGAGLDSYIIKKMSEYYAIEKPQRYSNDDLERGKKREPQAKFLYETETGLKVEDITFVILNDYVGCSPDGFVGDKGLVEFKAPNDLNYFSLLLDFKIKPEYDWQMQMQMDICEREWCDYVVYNPMYEPSLIIKRVFRDELKINKLRQGYIKGENLIKDIKSKIESKKVSLCA